MDPQITNAFTDIIHTAESIFTAVSVKVDSTSERSILRIQARYGRYDIFITELVDHSSRKYRYYILDENYVEAGFDNSPDPRALRLKYGRIGEEHAGESIPHWHQANKTQLSLTDELFFLDFLDWLKQNLPLIKV